MMGTQHALLGATLWSGFITLQPQSLHEAVIGYAVCVGASILPDLDHPGSTVSKSLGLASQLLCALVVAVTGGHRRGTHSLLGCFAITGLFLLAVELRPAWYGSAILTILLLLLFESVCRLIKRPGPGDEIAAAVAAVALAWTPQLDLSYIPVAVLVGVLSHLLGDGITKQGIPLLWPLERKNYRLARMTAGGPLEVRFLRPVMAIAVPAIPLAEPVWTLLNR
jgi:membrane-bound metal-dependent hydrolase YbcI (DUF457 family)